MTSCRCTETTECNYHAGQIDDAEDRKRGYYREFTERELGDMADAAAERDWAGRDF